GPPAAARALPPEGKLQSSKQLSGVPWDEAGVQLLSAKATPHRPALVSSEFPGSRGAHARTGMMKRCVCE
ncbi:unnamed protein product, partial [Rangifer tarandus platyrhynchus]